MSTSLAADLPDLTNLLVAAGDLHYPGRPENLPAKSALLLFDDEDLDSAPSRPELLAGLAPRGHVAILLRLESSSPVRRLLQFLWLPVRVRRAVRSLRSMGISNCERFAVSPDVRQPVFIHSLQRAPAAYARNNILPPHRGPSGILRWLVSRWAGCDPSVGALLVVGTAP
jgi:rhodanese-related sulfurtransferase